MKKRKRTAPAPAQQPAAPEDDEEDTSHLTEYELQRLQIIARNRARLLALGIPEAVKNLQALLPHPRQRSAKRAKREAQPPHEPTRRSSRLQQQAAEQPEPGSELAIFVIDGECPRCGKVVTRGHKQHLERCEGPPEPVQLTEEELAAAAQQQLAKDKQKLQQLELGGLVELTSEQATFVVIGSTGNHYVVTFSDAKRSCQCMDHRIRRRDCKHIKLVASQLGVVDDMGRWQQGVEHMLGQLPAASAADKARVQQAEARQAARAAKSKGKAAGQQEGATAAVGAPGSGSKQRAAAAGGQGGGRGGSTAAHPAQEMAMKFM